MSAGAAGAAAAAMIQATKASGVIVRVEPDEFLDLLERQEEAPLVVHATGGFFSTNHQYLTSYKGLAFFTKSGAPIHLPEDTEIVEARRIWIPG